MRWRDAIIRSCGPGSFCGLTPGIWWKVLRDNRFSIDLPYWPRAAIITLGTVPNAVLSFVENLLFRRRIERTEVPAPLFVLGSWRSGTTHLHNLLSVDDRFAFPNFYQVAFPRTFLLTERSGAWIFDLFLPNQRPQDAVTFGVAEPQEDEYALCSLTGQSMLLMMAFPRNARYYDRFLALQGLSAGELAMWKACLLRLLKKLTLKYHRPLVLKSPGHTARIGLLLELFPEAKFVHIRRNPYDVYRSSKHTLAKARPWWQLQRTGETCDADDDDMIIHQYKTMCDAYFDQRALIPDGHLHELAYEDLERDPIAQIRETYAALRLPDFGHVEQPLRRYVDQLSGYQKNAHPELPADSRHRLNHAWKMCFDEWGYPA